MTPLPNLPRTGARDSSGGIRDLDVDRVAVGMLGNASMTASLPLPQNSKAENRADLHSSASDLVADLELACRVPVITRRLIYDLRFLHLAGCGSDLCWRAKAGI